MTRTDTSNGALTRSAGVCRKRIPLSASRSSRKAGAVCQASRRAQEVPPVARDVGEDGCLSRAKRDSRLDPPPRRPRVPQIHVNPGELLLFDNLSSAHGRVGIRTPKELNQPRLLLRKAQSVGESVLTHGCESKPEPGRTVGSRPEPTSAPAPAEVLDLARRNRLGSPKLVAAVGQHRAQSSLRPLHPLALNREGGIE